MTRATLTFGIEAENMDRVNALREDCGTWLDQHDDVTVTLRQSSEDTRWYQVSGVEGKQPFTERVQATSEEDAKAQVIGNSKTKVVSLVVPLP